MYEWLEVVMVEEVFTSMRDTSEQYCINFPSAMA